MRHHPDHDPAPREPSPQLLAALDETARQLAERAVDHEAAEQRSSAVCVASLRRKERNA